MTAKPNPQSISSARKLRKLTIHEVSSFTKISEDRLLKFEDGSADPSIAQLSRLGELYNASFVDFFRSDLTLNGLMLDFRKTRPTSADLSPKGLRRIWQIQGRAAFTEELVRGLGSSKPKVSSLTRYTNSGSPSASELRNAFDDWLRLKQKPLRLSGAGEDLFAKHARVFLEVHACQTTFNSAPTEDYLGFFDRTEKQSNILFVNRDIRNEKRKLFTFCHEIAHYVYNEEGISNPLAVAKNAIERRCNSYAAEFLAPEDLIGRIVQAARKSDVSDADRLINLIAKDTMLSRQASAIRLQELGYITKRQSSTFFQKLGGLRRVVEPSAAKTKTPMGSAAAIGRALSEVGLYASYVAKLAYDRKLVDNIDIERGLGLSPTIQGRVLDLAAKRFEVGAE